MSLTYRLCGSPGLCASGIGDGMSPLSTTVQSERRELLAEAGDAERRRSHVGAAAIAAEIERHADDVNGLR